MFLMYGRLPADAVVPNRADRRLRELPDAATPSLVPDEVHGQIVSGRVARCRSRSPYPSCSCRGWDHSSARPRGSGEPEGRVRAVRADDAPDRARLIEIAHEAGDGERELSEHSQPVRSGKKEGAPAAPPAEPAQVSTRSRRTIPRPRISSSPTATPSGGGTGSSPPCAPSSRAAASFIWIDSMPLSCLRSCIRVPRYCSRLPGRSSAYGYCSICPEQPLERELGHHAR